MTTGSKISKLRRENNYTQEQLAELLGVSRQAISKWESDKAYPETEKLIQMSKLFSCSLDYLLRDDMEEKLNQEETTSKNDDFTFSFSKLNLERKSKKMVWGLPLWQIGKNAKGILAIGIHAKGILAIGIDAKGIFSAGLFSLGLISSGFLSIGLCSSGVLSLGVLSAGAVSAGIFSAGAISFGIISVGAMAIGKFAIGALAIGDYFAQGANASGMIAIGDEVVKGELFEKLGTLTEEEISTVKHLLDANVPSYLNWAKELIKNVLK